MTGQVTLFLIRGYKNICDELPSIHNGPAVPGVHFLQAAERVIQTVRSENDEALRFFIIAAASIGAVVSTVFPLTHGIFEVFPFLYILPIILVVLLLPGSRRGLLLGISLMYICLVYLFGYSNPGHIAIATAWFAIFIIIGVVVSSYATKAQQEKARIHQILNNSQDGISCFDIRTEQMLEINAKCAQWLRYEREELRGQALQ